MRIPTFKRLNKQDYDSKYSDLIDKLGFSLNNGIDPLYSALNKRLSITDNFLSTVKDLSVITDSSGSVLSGGSFKIDFTGSILGMQVIRAENQTNTGTYPTTAPWPSYQITTDGIQIVNITGLQANNTYNIKVIVWGA